MLHRNRTARADESGYPPIADIRADIRDRQRSAPKATSAMSHKGQSATWRHRLATSGLAPISDIGRGRQHVRKVPEPDVQPASRVTVRRLHLLAWLQGATVESRRLAPPSAIPADSVRLVAGAFPGLGSGVKPNDVPARIYLLHLRALNLLRLGPYIRATSRKR